METPDESINFMIGRPPAGAKNLTHGYQSEQFQQTARLISLAGFSAAQPSSPPARWVTLTV